MVWIIFSLLIVSISIYLLTNRKSVWKSNDVLSCEVTHHGGILVQFIKYKMPRTEKVIATDIPLGSYYFAKEQTSIFLHSVTLKIEDRKGDMYYLLCITPSGNIYRLTACKGKYRSIIGRRKSVTIYSDKLF